MNLRVTHNSRSGTKSRGGKTGTTSRRDGETWATPANAGGFHMTRKPGRLGEERDKCYSQRMPRNDEAKAKRSEMGSRRQGPANGTHSGGRLLEADGTGTRRRVRRKGCKSDHRTYSRGRLLGRQEGRTGTWRADTGGERETPAQG